MGDNYGDNVEPSEPAAATSKVDEIVLIGLGIAFGGAALLDVVVRVPAMEWLTALLGDTFSLLLTGFPLPFALPGWTGNAVLLLASWASLFVVYAGRDRS